MSDVLAYLLRLIGLRRPVLAAGEYRVLGEMDLGNEPRLRRYVIESGCNLPIANITELPRFGEPRSTEYSHLKCTSKQWQSLHAGVWQVDCVYESEGSSE